MKGLIREARFCKSVAQTTHSGTAQMSGVAQTISIQCTTQMANDYEQSLRRNVQAPVWQREGKGGDFQIIGLYSFMVTRMQTSL